MEEAHCEAWRAYINANASPVSDNFAGLLRSTVECCKCHHRRYGTTPYLDLSLPLTPPPSNVRSRSPPSSRKGSTSCTLEECLEQFTATEDLTEKITCEKCKKPQKSQKSLWHWNCVCSMAHPGAPREALLVHGKNKTFSEKLDTLGHVPDGGPRPESVRVRGPAERPGRLRPLRDDGSSRRFRCGGALRRAPEGSERLAYV